MKTLVSKAILSACVSALLLSSTASYADSRKLNSDIVALETGMVVTHPIMAVELLPAPGKELMVLGAQNNQRVLQIYTNNSIREYVKAREIVVPDSLHRFDISQYQEGTNQQVYFLSSDTLFLFNPTAVNPFEKVVNVATTMPNKNSDYLAKDDFLFDDNNDGVAEALIQGFTQVSVLKFSDKSVLKRDYPIAAKATINGEIVTYQPPEILVEDLNFDGLNDLIELQNGQITYYPQTKDALFSQQAAVVPLKADFLVDDWWDKKDSDGRSLDQSNLSLRRIAHLEDINNDDIPDLIVINTTSNGALDRTNDYEIYLGQKKTNTLSYNDKPDSVLTADGTLGRLKVVDIDNDNRKEMMLSGVDIGVSQIISALVSGSVDQDVYLFGMTKNNRFSSKPIISKETELSFSISSGTAGNALTQLADFNGDGLKDLVLSSGDSKLKVFFANRSSTRFERLSKSMSVDIPGQGNDVTAADINNDGIDELLLKYSRLDEPELQSKILLIKPKNG
ncbi:FG-GAP repeat domain-containing protein [Veronia pacifica]|uniref:VCBS repeat-containing protein n=1 Tax=Veronia pacifica TaxID=1080227 RepID=A0A1C3E8Y7_9GAMM|nr:VCBS repeat-containing protein [Veronia pacifica]ODA29686.1 hypothetical protein A8L45_21920 [Veronia pacifica]